MTTKIHKFWGGSLLIVTENVDGEIYCIEAGYVMDVIDDWRGKCNFVPENDARVFFAAWNGCPINPHEYTNFESLLRYLERSVIS